MTIADNGPEIEKERETDGLVVYNGAGGGGRPGLIVKLRISLP